MSLLEKNIQTFSNIDDEMKQLNEQLKILRQNKGSLEATISDEMTQNSIQEVVCEDETKVKVYTKRLTKNAFNKSNVQSCAVKLFGEDNADALVKMIEQMQEVEESTGLKRLNSKKRKIAPTSQLE